MKTLYTCVGWVVLSAACLLAVYRVGNRPGTTSSSSSSTPEGARMVVTLSTHSSGAAHLPPYHNP
jgi:hypothetical protein